MSVALSSFCGLPVLFFGRSFSFARTLAICSLRAAFTLPWRRRAPWRLALAAAAALAFDSAAFLRAASRALTFTFLCFAIDSSPSPVRHQKRLRIIPSFDPDHTPGLHCKRLCWKQFSGLTRIAAFHGLLCGVST